MGVSGALVRRRGRHPHRLIRVRYTSGRLGVPETLIDNIQGRGNHDGSRLAIGPDRLL